MHQLHKELKFKVDISAVLREIWAYNNIHTCGNASCSVGLHCACIERAPI